MKKILRTLNTIRYLKPTQLAFFFLRRKFPAKKISLKNRPSLNRSFSFSSPIPVAGGIENEKTNTFNYLNQPRCFGASIDWQCLGLPRLWGYNLHYFDYLRNEEVNVEVKKILMEEWIKSNPQNSQPGWEPFTASLRIVNWVIFLAANREQLTDEIQNSLYLQMLWLEKNDERHILANHYFENLKAMLFAGVFFQGKDARRWRKRATTELLKQLDEQTLTDGGHYERSPQYHSLMLENYLDLYNVASSNKHHFDAGFIEQVQQTAEAGLCWLEQTVFPDGQIPLFNDSALSIAPTLKELSQYASRLFNFSACSENARSSDANSLIDLPDSGLYGARLAADMLIMDCGDIGPAYQPGHTHCDLLSFELMRANQRIIVDTGVCEYSPGEIRQQLRSTSAHNTVSINGLEQSEVWGEFRVARRAKKLGAAILKEGDNIAISGAYAGFYEASLGWRPSYRHARQINVKLAKDSFGVISVVDRLSRLNSSQKRVSATSYLHFHPDVSVSLADKNSAELRVQGSLIAKLKIAGNGSAQVKQVLVDSYYYPEFGLRQNNKCLEMSVTGELPLEFGYELQWE